MSSPPVPRLAIRIDPADNVATALVPLAAGQRVDLEPPVTLPAPVPRGHKFALRPIAAGEPVIKYGQPMGRATRPILPGEHVHTHNCISQRAGSGGGRDA